MAKPVIFSHKNIEYDIDPDLVSKVLLENLGKTNHKKPNEDQFILTIKESDGEITELESNNSSKLKWIRESIRRNKRR